MFAAIRPHSIDLALIVHVAGAMVLVGALVTAAAAGIIGWRDEAGALRRLSYRTLLFVALPAWFVMWFGAIWTESREHLDDLSNPPAWLGIGHIAAEGGGLLLLIALILGGIGTRRSRAGNGDGLIRASSAMATFLVAVYVIAIWAMGAKPS
jgi:hypothetical protein